MSAAQQKAWYRPDIDGLRALAVVAVILFHAELFGVTGGFVGVDVFFVISGFLITSIIVRQLQAGTFSLTRFWERRIRRIVPVLTAVLLTTTAAAYVILLYPLDFLDYGQSLLAQSFFLSNLFFLRKSDYFADSAEAEPLLHTWSLAIEEQFYILLPLILLLLWRFGRYTVLFVLGALCIGSLWWCVSLLAAPDAAFSIPGLPPLFASATNATAAFYLLPTRAFELLVGVLLALLSVRLPTRWMAELAAWTGFGILLRCFFVYTDTTAFPGVAALVPVLATALLIAAHTERTTTLHHVLTVPGVIWVGLLSYSLYLWHWPVLVLGKQWLQVSDLSDGTTAVLLLITVMLSVLSYYLIETPGRTWRPQTARWHVFVVGIGCLAFLASIGWYITATNGLPTRAPEAAQQIARGTTDFGAYWNECFVHSFSFTTEPCQFGAVDIAPTHMLLGDSHGGALLSTYAAAADAAGVGAVSYISAGCSPLKQETEQNPKGRCAVVRNLAKERLARGDITDVLLISRWTSYAERSHAAFAADVSDTIDELRSYDVRVWVLLQVPHHQYYNARTAFADAVTLGALPDYTLPRQDHEARQAIINDTFLAVAAIDPAVVLLDPTPLLCTDTVCALTRDNVLLYKDSNHLNQAGGAVLRPLFDQFFGVDGILNAQ